MNTIPITIIEMHGNKMLVRKAIYEDIEELVFTLVQLIPIGHVVTYGDIAKILKINPKFVGILSRNKQPIVIPCHRVVSSKGFGGYTLLGRKVSNLKKKLLQLESRGRITRFNICEYLGFNKLSKTFEKL
ncbi:MAG: MGMT family protein [Ignisphaera sp.]